VRKAEFRILRITTWAIGPSLRISAWLNTSFDRRGDTLLGFEVIADSTLVGFVSSIGLIKKGQSAARGLALLLILFFSPS
jgi:hypothetical protein